METVEIMNEKRLFIDLSKLTDGERDGNEKTRDFIR